MLTFTDISKDFGVQKTLKDINLTIYPQEFVLLIGPSGAGKSTLMHLLLGAQKPTTGSIQIDGTHIENLDTETMQEYRRMIGMVFQDFQLLTDRPVRDNLLFVLGATGWKDKRLMNTRTNEVLERVGLKYKDDKLPHQLSGGEQQRVVVARALLNDPEIILADEPTGNLDPETSEDLMQLLLSISQNGRAVIMATHDYAMIRKFPARTFKCEKGSLEAI